MWTEARGGRHCQWRVMKELLEVTVMFCILMMVVVTKMYKERRKTFVSQSCLTLCGPMDCSLPGFSVHGILHVRIQEWIVASPGDLSNPGIKLGFPACIADRFFTVWATRETCQNTSKYTLKWVYFIACKVISQSYFLKEFFKPLWTYLLEKVFVGIIS